MDMEHRQGFLSRCGRGLAAGAAAGGQRGFSLIEVLIAAAILLIVALGILPLFSQAIVSNRAGADYTTATNFAKSELERLFSLPLASPELAVDGGPTTRTAYYLQSSKLWVAVAPTAETALWTRTVTVTPRAAGEIFDDDGDGSLDPALSVAAGASAPIREITVQVVSGRYSDTVISVIPLGLGKRVTLRTYKSF